MKSRAIPAELSAESITAVIDTREQAPLNLSPLRTVAGALTTGDYSIAGLEHVVAVERKSESDLLACIGQERERFEKEIQRMLAFPARALVIESTWQRIEAGEWRSKITSAAAIGSLLSWIAMGLPVIMADTHERAGRYVSRLLYTAARRRYREARALLQGLERMHEGDPSAKALLGRLAESNAPTLASMGIDQSCEPLA